MIKDLQMMQDITPLFEKKLVIWGMGQRGQKILGDIVSMGAGKKGILLCDSDSGKWGKRFDRGEYQGDVLSPENLQDELLNMNIGETAVLVTVASVEAQDEILGNIAKTYGEEIEIYTDYAIECGICLNRDNPCMDKGFEERRKQNANNQSLESVLMKPRERALRYFALLPLHNDQIILVYQRGKVGSRTVYKSIEAHGGYVLHCHGLEDVGENADDLYRILNLKSGKIICLVRDPVAREVSAMWQHLYRIAHDGNSETTFLELEKRYISEDIFKREFQWFEWQMKKVFHIDVFQYPFDREKGYGIIREGNIELLLMKLEKLDQLQEIIGSFLGIEDFCLRRDNVGGAKPYRFAYQEYRKNLRISRDLLEQIYKKDECMKHFYTEQECDALYMKWLNRG